MLQLGDKMARNKGKSIIKYLKLWPEVWQKLREAKFQLDIPMETLANNILICCLEDPECLKQAARKSNKQTNI